jgi:NADH dehydrogenase
MKIAVTGAFSYSGKYIAKRLLDRGEEVITLTGHPNRPDPFSGKVKAYPLDFDETNMVHSLQGVSVLVNTYWVRFNTNENTQQRAVENTRKLVNAAKAAGVTRIVHISIANPSSDSPLPYFSGKAFNEKIVIESGLGYSILRPTVLIGDEDILINNIAYLLRHFPFFALPGDGSYKLQPIYVDDLAELVVEGVYSANNYIIDAAGPDIFTFKKMVELIGEKIGAKRPLILVPPGWR